MRRSSSDSPQVAAARRVGVDDPRVLEAVAAVPRSRFVPESALAEVDADRPVRIGAGQTTSQPSLIAATLEALELTGQERVLEVGTGFGYQAALLAHLAAEVHTIERFEQLAVQARENLASIGLERVNVVAGDGTLGLPEHAPYDAIVVAAAAAEVPHALGEQLVVGGRLIAPVGTPGDQALRLYERRSDGLVETRHLVGVRFVPLIAGDPD